MVELTFQVRRFSSATYFTSKAGVSFAKTLLFMTTIRVSTDRLLVSDEAVRVIDSGR